MCGILNPLYWLCKSCFRISIKATTTTTCCCLLMFVFLAYAVRFLYLFKFSGIEFTHDILLDPATYSVDVFWFECGLLGICLIMGLSLSAAFVWQVLYWYGLFAF